MTAAVWTFDPGKGSWFTRADRTQATAEPQDPAARLLRLAPDLTARTQPGEPTSDGAAEWTVPGLERDDGDRDADGLSAQSRAALAEMADAVQAHRLTGARVYRALTALKTSDALAESGYRHLSRLLADHVRLDPSETNRLARHAAALHETTSPSGAVVPADLPATSSHVDDGTVGDGHVEVIRDTMIRLRRVEDLGEEVLATTEEQLATLAATHSPIALKGAASVIADRLDPDGAAPAEDPPPPDELSYTRRRNGELRAKVILRDPVSAELFDQAIRAATLPPESAALADPETGAAPVSEDGERGEAPEVEAEHSKPARQAAALIDLIIAGHAEGLDEPDPGDDGQPPLFDHHADSDEGEEDRREFGGPDPDYTPDPCADAGNDQDDTAPDQGHTTAPDPVTEPGPVTDPESSPIADTDSDTSPPEPLRRPSRRRKPGDTTPIQLTVTVDYDTLRDQLADRSKALALLGDATWIRPETVRQLACDAEIIPMVLGSKGEVLDVGRKSRTPPAGLRRAIWARDRHCAFPGCRRKPRLCQIHHIHHWGHGGDTDPDNLTGVCTYHHGLVHRSGWHIVMHDHLPWFIPPKWLDPTQTPRHNRPWTL